MRALLGEDPPLLVAFDTGTGGACLVAAGPVEVVPGMVYRYRRAVR